MTALLPGRPKPRRVGDYCADRVLHKYPSRWRIVLRRGDEFAISILRPHCFACREPAVVHPRARSLTQIWNRSDLERAHIDAGSTENLLDPANFLLLCAMCHATAPMTSNPVVMIEWAKNQKHCDVVYIEALEKELKLHGISIERSLTVTLEMYAAAFDRVMAAHHWGRYFSLATRAAVIAKALEVGVA